MGSGADEREPASNAEETLESAIADLPGQSFAVLDGAQFDDLPAMFNSERLFARSLYLDQADHEIEKASPWVVPLSQEEAAREKVVRLVGQSPALVVWTCRDGEAILYRHLRGLNLIRIPKWAADGGEGPPAAEDTADDAAAATAVFFRHWDPRVLESMLPVLDASQFARFLGPADQVLFRGASKNRRVIADPTWPAPHGGPLTLTAAQIEALTERRIEVSRRWIARYLREVAPDEIGSASEEQVRRHVIVSEAEGSRLGIQSEQGHARWALLMLMSEGRIMSMPDQLRFIAKGSRSPDEQVERLIDITADAMREKTGSRAG